MKQHQIANFKDVQNKVAAKIPNKWRIFGTQLDIPQAILDSFEQKNNDLLRRFTEVLVYWEKTQIHPFTWNTVINILMSPAIQEPRLVSDLMSRQFHEYHV